MDKFVKRVQSRLQYKGVKATKQQCREAYLELVANPEAPSDEQLDLVVERLKTQLLNVPVDSPAVPAAAEVAHSDLAIPTPEVSEDLTEDFAIAPVLNAPELPEQPEQPVEEEASNGALIQASSPLATATPSITQAQISEAVQAHFGKESAEIKGAILNYVAKDTFTSAQELQQALARLREMQLDILMKIVLEHNQESHNTESRVKDALSEAARQREQEKQNFFAQFENQLAEMRAAFNL